MLFKSCLRSVWYRNAAAIVCLLLLLSLSCSRHLSGTIHSLSSAGGSTEDPLNTSSSELSPILLIRDREIVDIGNGNGSPLISGYVAEPLVLLVYPGSTPRIVNPNWDKSKPASSAWWQPDHHAVHVVLAEGKQYTYRYNANDQTFGKPEMVTGSQ